MASRSTIRRRFDFSIADIIDERRARSPKDPTEAALPFIALLAEGLLLRETGKDRREQVRSDFRQAASELIDAAWSGADAEDQFEILRAVWKRLKLPEADLRKRRTARGPTAARLFREYEALYRDVSPISKARKCVSRKATAEKLKKVAPWAAEKVLTEAAESAPAEATCILLGKKYALSPATIRNRVSNARTKTLV